MLPSVKKNRSSAPKGILTGNVCGIPYFGILILLLGGAIVAYLFLTGSLTGANTTESIGVVSKSGQKVPSTLSKATEVLTSTHTCAKRDQTKSAAEYLARSKATGTCSGEEWMWGWQHRDNSGRKVMVDIGCGYGLAAAGFVGIFAGELGINRSSMAKALQSGIMKKAGYPELGLGDICDPQCAAATIKGQPACLYETANKIPSHFPDLEVHCVEPSIRMSQQVILARDALTESKEDSIKSTHGTLLWKNYPGLALSDKPGKMSYPQDCKAASCKVNPSGEGTPVQVHSLTSFIAAENITQVDLLRISTHGHDEHVIKGAKDFISIGKPVAVIFDFHGVDAWKKNGLRDTTKWFEKKGYACFMDQTPQVFKVTHGCWSDSYGADPDSKGNVVCVRSDHIIHTALDGMSFNVDMSAEEYTVQG